MMGKYCDYAWISTIRRTRTITSHNDPGDRASKDIHLYARGAETPSIDKVKATLKPE